MILPTISISTTPEIFQIHFKHLISDFVNEKNCKIRVNKFRIGSLQIRYELGFVQDNIAGLKDSEEISAEIEIIPISEGTTDIRVANLVIKPNEVWFGFFSSLYQLCYKKWSYVSTDPDISDLWLVDFN